MLESIIAPHLLNSLEHCEILQRPYPHFLLRNVLPGEVCAAIRELPLQPPAIADTLGRRETHNSSRQFFNPENQAKHEVCAALAEALQNPGITRMLAKQFGAKLHGSHLRIEYCLDINGFWLEPHTDIGAKFFTLLIYLSGPPAGEDWGTDIFDAEKNFIASAPCHANTGLIFVPGANTWHGFRPRKITGIRRSLIVNYVTPQWRARHELAFPDEVVE